MDEREKKLIWKEIIEKCNPDGELPDCFGGIDSKDYRAFQNTTAYNQFFVDELVKIYPKFKALAEKMWKKFELKVKRDEEFDKRQEERKKDDIIALLDETELSTQYLDLGKIKDEWYYGFKLGGNEAILTSSRKIYVNKEVLVKDTIIGENEIKALFNYKGYIGDISPTISNSTVKQYYTATENMSDPPKIYDKVKALLLYYMDFGEDETIADVITCWIIATYCYPLFYWFPHVLFNAPSTSGKTKCAFITTQLSFRGFDLGASGGLTPPQMFRTLEGNHGTTLIDEFEYAKGHSTQDTQRLVNQILNASAANDSYVIRTEQVNRQWMAWKFPIFSPKLVCNIDGINSTSLSRFIPFKWLKTEGIKGSRKPTRATEKHKFVDMREELYILILENWKEIEKMYNSIELENLNNRVEDNWLPLFAIAQFIDNHSKYKTKSEKLTCKLCRYVENHGTIEIDTEDKIEDFMRLLYFSLPNALGEAYYTPKEISNHDGMSDLFTDIKSPPNRIGKILLSFKFKTNRGGGKRKYLLSKENTKHILDLYFPNWNESQLKDDKKDSLPKVNCAVLCCFIRDNVRGKGVKPNNTSDSSKSAHNKQHITTHTTHNNTKQHKQHNKQTNTTDTINKNNENKEERKKEEKDKGIDPKSPEKQHIDKKQNNTSETKQHNNSEVETPQETTAKHITLSVELIQEIEHNFESIPEENIEDLEFELKDSALLKTPEREKPETAQEYNPPTITMIPAKPTQQKTYLNYNDFIHHMLPDTILTLQTADNTKEPPLIEDIIEALTTGGFYTRQQIEIWIEMSLKNGDAYTPRAGRIQVL